MQVGRLSKDGAQADRDVDPAHARASTSATGAQQRGASATSIVALQRSAGNRAVTSWIASVAPRPAPVVQREAPTATLDPERRALYAGMWGTSVMKRITEIGDSLRAAATEEGEYAAFKQLLARNESLGLQHFVLMLMQEVPDQDPLLQRLRILRRTIDGIDGVLAERTGSDQTKTLLDDLRFWRKEAVDLGPTLTHRPTSSPATGGTTAPAGSQAPASGPAQAGSQAPASGPAPATPAPAGASAQEPQAAPAVVSATEAWTNGVVLPLGRAIVRTERDPNGAASAASEAYQVVGLWRQAAPPGDERLRLIALERGVEASFDLLVERSQGAGAVDVHALLARLAPEAEAVGKRLGWTGIPSAQPAASGAAPATPPQPAAAGAPFVPDASRG